MSDLAARFSRGYSNEIAMRKLQDTRLEGTRRKTSKKERHVQHDGIPSISKCNLGLFKFKRRACPTFHATGDAQKAMGSDLNLKG